MIKCTRCQEEKSEAEFYLKSGHTSKRVPACKKCSTLKVLSPRIVENRKAIELGLKTCSQCLIVYPLDKFQFYGNENRYDRVCKECKKFNQKESYKNNPEIRKRRRITQKIWASKNRERNAFLTSRWAKNNRDRIKQNYHKRMSDPEYYVRFRAKINARESINPDSKIKRNIVRRIRRLLANKTSVSGKVKKMIGCSIETLKLYLESKFQPGMSWDNYGHKGWHIDHIIPCRAFNLIDPNDVEKCFHYSNLQPLWAPENLSKQDKMPCGSRARDIYKKST